MLVDWILGGPVGHARAVVGSIGPVDLNNICSSNCDQRKGVIFTGVMDALSTLLVQNASAYDFPTISTRNGAPRLFLKLVLSTTTNIKA